MVEPGTQEVELYDRTRDPYELTNMAYRPAYRETRAGLARKLAALQGCSGSACYRVGADDISAPAPEPFLARGATVHPDDLASIGTARQVVTITAPGWNTARGRLTAWTRHGRTWTVRRGPVPVRLGGNGLVPEGMRRHGTAETPAGTFRPHRTFGLSRAPQRRCRTSESAHGRAGSSTLGIPTPTTSPSRGEVRMPNGASGAPCGGRATPTGSRGRC